MTTEMGSNPGRLGLEMELGISSTKFFFQKMVMG